MAKTKNNAGTDAKNKQTTGEVALEKIGRDLLEANVEFSAVYITGDGTAFGAKSDAENHAKTLTDTNVVTVERETPNE